MLFASKMINHHFCFATIQFKIQFDVCFYYKFNSYNYLYLSYEWFKYFNYSLSAFFKFNKIMFNKIFLFQWHQKEQRIINNDLLLWSNDSNCRIGSKEVANQLWTYWNLVSIKNQRHKNTKSIIYITLTDIKNYYTNPRVNFYCAMK